MGVTEVTFAQYRAFCDATGRPLPNDAGWGSDTRPVIHVTWDDARAYATWLGAMTGWGCRLPSEAEWEYAARAGTTSAYGLPAPTGSDDIRGKGLAKCADCGGEWAGRQTAPVRQFPANAWNLYDMHGNVWEWVEDCSHFGYQNAPTDGTAWLDQSGGDCFFRVLRGGSWFDDQVARSASRSGYSPFIRLDFIGFRVVCSPPSSGR